MYPVLLPSKSQDNYITVVVLSLKQALRCTMATCKTIFFFSPDSNQMEGAILASSFSAPPPSLPPTSCQCKLMLWNVGPGVTKEKVHMFLVSTRNENLQIWERLPLTCLTCVFNDLQVLTAKMTSSLGRHLKGSDKPTIVGQNDPGYK